MNLCTCADPEDGTWVPYCDTCGDIGCSDCSDGTVPNHICERWQSRPAEPINSDCF